MTQPEECTIETKHTKGSAAMVLVRMAVLVSPDQATELAKMILDEAENANAERKKANEKRRAREAK